MEVVYKLIQENPKYFAWAFGLINVLWGIFCYFNKQSHDKAMEKLKYLLILEQEEKLPLIRKLSDLEEQAGEAKEIVTSYRGAKEKKEVFLPVYKKLEQLAGQFSKYPALMQVIRELTQYCSIMVQDDPHPHDSCREDVLKKYKNLIKELEKVKCNIKA